MTEEKVGNPLSTEHLHEPYIPFREVVGVNEKKENHLFALKYDKQKIRDIYKEFMDSPFDDFAEFEKHRDKQ